MQIFKRRWIASYSLADPNHFLSDADFSYRNFSFRNFNSPNPNFRRRIAKSYRASYFFDLFQTFGLVRTLVSPKIYIILFFLAQYVFDTLGKSFQHPQLQSFQIHSLEVSHHTYLPRMYRTSRSRLSDSDTYL